MSFCQIKLVCKEDEEEEKEDNLTDNSKQDLQEWKCKMGYKIRKCKRKSN